MAHTAEFWVVLLSAAAIGVALAQVVWLAAALLASPRGYRLKAIGRVWYVLAVVYIVEFVLSAIIGYALPILGSDSVIRWLSVLVLSFCVGAAPNGIVAVVAAVVRYESFHSQFIKKLVAFLRVTTSVQLKTAVQDLREEDNIAWQYRKPDWNYGVDPKVIGRRIRALYAKVKWNIAVKCNDASLLRMDYGVHPGQLFYLLVDHLGREQVRQTLASAGFGWSGKENRRQQAPGKLRQDNEPFSRAYDYPGVEQSVALEHANRTLGPRPSRRRIVLRWATPEDARAIQELEREVWRDLAFTGYDRLLRICPESVLIASNGDLLGYIAVERIDPTDLGKGMPPWNHDPEAIHRDRGAVWYIVNHAVSEAARGMGVSPALISKLIDEARMRPAIHQIAVIYNRAHPYIPDPDAFWGRYGFNPMPETEDPDWGPAAGGEKTGAILYARRV